MLIVSLLILAALYTGVARHLAVGHALYVSDTEARLVMIRNWQEHGSPVYLRYDHEALDPNGRLHPLGLLSVRRPTDGTLIRTGRGFCTIYPPLFVVLSATAMRVFGFSGLFILPVLGGLGTALLVGLLARRLGLRSYRLLPLMLGLATPLAFYAVSFWDHSLHMLLVAVAGWTMLLVLEKKRIRYAVLSGAALGIGMLFHELFALLFTATFVAALVVLWRSAWRRMTLGLLVGFVPFVLLWAVVNTGIYGHPGGPHFTGMENITQGARIAELMRPGEIAARSREQLFGFGAARPTDGLFLILLLVIVASGWIGGRVRAIGLSAGVLLAGIALGWIRAVHCAVGLFQATPLLVGALAPPVAWGRTRFRDDEPSSIRAFLAWISLASVVYMALVLIAPQTPGVVWGSRYLLTALPFYALLAARGLERGLRGGDGVTRMLAIMGVCALLAVSLYSEWRGIQTIEEVSRSRRAFINKVHGYAARAFIADDTKITIALAADPPPVPVFLVRDPEDYGVFFAALARLGLREFTYLKPNEAAFRKLVAAAAGRPRPFVPEKPWSPMGFQARFVLR